MDNRLSELRSEIDKIDDELVKLFVKRQETAAAIGKYKAENNITVTDAAREDKVISKAKERAGEEYADDIAELYKTVLSLSRQKQRRDNNIK